MYSEESRVPEFLQAGALLLVEYCWASNGFGYFMAGGRFILKSVFKESSSDIFAGSQWGTMASYHYHILFLKYEAYSSWSSRFPRGLVTIMYSFALSTARTCVDPPSKHSECRSRHYPIFSISLCRFMSSGSPPTASRTVSLAPGN
jgi:hypothetical protein